jgi:hypothetical protein
VTTDHSDSAAAWETFLELGAENKETSTRLFNAKLRGRESYDFFELAKFFKEILDFHELGKRDSVSLDEIHRKEKVLFLHEIFRFLEFRLSYLEIGSSLFELIDGLELVQRLTCGEADLKSEILYHGIELSPLLQRAAIHLHPGYRIRHVTEETAPPRFDVLYDRQVASYRYGGCAELAAFMNRARISFMNLLLSRTVTFDYVNEVGMIQTRFGLPGLLRRLDKPLYYLFGRETADRIDGFFLNGAPEDIAGVMRGFCENPYLDEFMRLKHVTMIDPKTLILSDPEGDAVRAESHTRQSLHDRLEEYHASRGILIER